MKPQDFMKALGGVSQEKLNALAKWQNAKTPITGEIHVQDVSVQEAAEQTVAPVKRRVTMKQSNTKRTPVGKMFPWRIGIGAAAVAAVVVAVSVGKDAIGQRNQMTVGMSGETLIAEQVSVQDTLPTVNVKQDPVPLIENLCAFSSTNETAPEISENGLVEVWRSMDDAAEFLENTQLNKFVICSKYFTEALFAAYDVLYVAHPDEKYLPENTIRFQISGGEFDTNGKLHLTIGALTMKGWETDFDKLESINHYWFYTVPKDSLPEISAWDFTTDLYQIGESDKAAKDSAADEDAIDRFIKTTNAYQRWDAAVNRQRYLTWKTDDSSSLPSEDSVETISADTAQTQQYVALMQEYYKQKSGNPCDFDFTGMGKDLDEIIETDVARFHVKGMVGCDWTMFVFFDVEPLNLSTKETNYFSSKEFPNLSDSLYLNFGILDAEGKEVDFYQRFSHTMPKQQRLDNGVFHCYSLLSSHSAEGFTDGKKYLGIAKMNEPDDPEYEIRISLDCLKTIPLQESKLASKAGTFISEDAEHGDTPRTMTRCAVTPFGVYCVSDTFDSEFKTGWAQSCYWLEVPECKLKATPLITQNNADGTVLGKIELDSQTSWGSSVKNGRGVSFADFLFDRPYNAAKGTLTIQQTE